MLVNLKSNEKIPMPHCKKCGATKNTLYYLSSKSISLCEKCLIEIGIECVNNSPDKYFNNRKPELYG